MTQYRTLDYAVDKGVARIAFNRPPANAIDGQMAKELFDVCHTSEKDESVRIRFLTGNGKYFNTGLDLKAIDLNDTDKIIYWMQEYLNPTVCTIIISPKLTVCAVNGPAVGAGASFALAANIIYMSSTAYFSFPFVAMGLIPDLLSSYTLQKAIGPHRASNILLHGKNVTAAQAESFGLTSAVYDSAGFESQAYVQALSLTKLDFSALAATKGLINSHENLISQCRTEEMLQSRLLRGETFRKAVCDFMRK